MPPTTADLIQDRCLGELLLRRDIDLTGVAAPQKVVREEVRGGLVGHGSAERIDDAVLVADELVGNALTHVGGPVLLTLDIYEKGAAVRVDDQGTDTEAVPTAPTSPWNVPDEGAFDVDAVPENGRGMFLVDLLSTAWSVEKAAGGKAVVAVFAMTDGDLP